MRSLILHGMVLLLPSRASSPWYLLCFWIHVCPHVRTLLRRSCKMWTMMWTSARSSSFLLHKSLVGVRASLVRNDPFLNVAVHLVRNVTVNVLVRSCRESRVVLIVFVDVFHLWIQTTKNSNKSLLFGRSTASQTLTGCCHERTATVQPIKRDCLLVKISVFTTSNLKCGRKKMFR